MERRRIRGVKDDYYLFRHINDIPFDKKGKLLETDEIKRRIKFNKKLTAVKTY